jgi:hypothetical protein
VCVHYRYRLKARSTDFSVFLETANMWICDIRVFFLSEFFLPSLFFLRVCGFEGGALAAVEV